MPEEDLGPWRPESDHPTKCLKITEELTEA
jgi:hypothetical protein